MPADSNHVALASVASQIIPVMMLTLLVEWRARAKWLSKKKNIERRRRRRWASAAGFYFTASLLFAIFMASLIAVMIGELETDAAVALIVALGLGGILLFLLPAAALSFALSADVYAALARRFPEPTNRAFLQKMEATFREWRNARISERIEIAAAYIELARDEGQGADESDPGGSSARADREAHLAKRRASLNQWRAAEAEAREDLVGQNGVLVATFADFLEKTHDVREMVRDNAL